MEPNLGLAKTSNAQHPVKEKIGKQKRELRTGMSAEPAGWKACATMKTNHE